MTAAIVTSILAVGLLLGLGSCSSAPRRGEECRGGGPFKNQGPFEDKSLWDVMKWKAKSEPAPWPEWIDSQPQSVPVPGDREEDLQITFINHSTVLLHYHGLNILTDPIWSDRPSPVGFAGPKRVRAPGVLLEDLPRLDVLLITHDHYDHLDLPTLRQLAGRHQPLVLTGMGNAELLRQAGFAQVEELCWWGTRRVGSLTVHFTPTQHFSGRGLFDRMKTLWGGFVLESPHGHIYFAGDTAAGPQDAQLATRFGAFRLSLLPIGAYQPRWFMKEVHTDPKEALDSHLAIHSAQSVAIHFGTFAGLADDGPDEPVEALAQALADRAVDPSLFRVLGFGETLKVGRPNLNVQEAKDDREASGL
jgi:L-ascorbate metabolism protein UlaG (beta-lactamase superfamily)